MRRAGLARTVAVTRIMTAGRNGLPAWPGPEGVARRRRSDPGSARGRVSGARASGEMLVVSPDSRRGRGGGVFRALGEVQSAFSTRQASGWLASDGGWILYGVDRAGVAFFGAAWPAIAV